MVRKGVGGTYPLRVAARELAPTDVLGTLLGIPPLGLANPTRTTEADRAEPPAETKLAECLSQGPAHPVQAVQALDVVGARQLSSGKDKSFSEVMVAAVDIADKPSRIPCKHPRLCWQAEPPTAAPSTAFAARDSPVTDSPAAVKKAEELENGVGVHDESLRESDDWASTAAEPLFIAEGIVGNVALPAEMAGEEGAEELLQEMPEQQPSGQPFSNPSYQPPNLYTLCSRLELYVGETTWTSLNR
jgi:hypothetical protein